MHVESIDRRDAKGVNSVQVWHKPEALEYDPAGHGMQTIALVAPAPECPQTKLQQAHGLRMRNGAVTVTE
jgi:hypothetical protein